MRSLRAGLQYPKKYRTEEGAEKNEKQEKKMSEDVDLDSEEAR